MEQKKISPQIELKLVELKLQNSPPKDRTKTDKDSDNDDTRNLNQLD